MRVVVDTNVLIDACADDVSPQARIIEAARGGDITAIITPAIQREYTKILSRLIQDPRQHKKVTAFLAAAEFCRPAAVADLVIDDAEDKKFVAAALGGAADLLITNDRHLLDIGEVGSLTIVKPVEAWQRVQENKAGDEEWNTWAKGLGLIVLMWALLLPFAARAAEAANVTEALQAKEQEIAELSAQIEKLQNKKDSAANEAELITAQVAALARRLEQAELELKQTQQSITAVQKKKEQTESTITEVESDIVAKKQQLRGLIRLLYSKEQISLIDVFLASHSLSEVLAEQQAVQTLQDQSLDLMQELQKQAEELRAHEATLAQQQAELVAASRLLDAQQSALDAQKKEQAQFLTAKREEQARFEQKIVEARAARDEIEAGLFALKSAGVQLSFNNATEMAKHASDLTGVRPSLLLAVLKIESNVGTNIGSGTFPDDMQPASREPFLRIAKSLGRDPAIMPISRSVSYGWGGAMGPAQIMPQTWEGIAPRLSDLLKKTTPDPYDLTDAFVATALLLADKGASSPAGEHEAVGRYLAGPNWQNFPWYVERVFAVADEYAKEGMR